jgi:hypothetical protein
MQHIGSNGAPAPGWDDAGVMLNPQGAQFDPRLASDGTGGAIVVWDNQVARSLYAQRFPGDSPTVTLLSLVSAEVQADRVSLLWQGDGAIGVGATVERRTEASGWEPLGAPTPEGSDQLIYEDRGVTSGARYAYRLRYTSDDTERTTPEAWVSVPAAARLALSGLRPNPARGSDLRVAFSLPDAAPARLELIDVTGRRIATHEVGSLGAGEHVERLQPESRVPAGLYWLRLTQAGRTLVTRAVVTG